MEYFVNVVLAIGLYLNVVATVQLWRSPAYDRRQKNRQTVLVWLLPFVGSVWVLNFLTENAYIPGPGVRSRSWLFHLLALSLFLSHGQAAHAASPPSPDGAVEPGFVPNAADGTHGVGGDADSGGGGDG